MHKKMTEEKLRKAVAESISIAETLKKLNMSITTGNYRSFHRAVKKYDLNIEHFLGQAHLSGKNNNIKTTIPLENILVENSTHPGGASLKKRLTRNKLLIYKCYNCGISEWDDKPLSLQLDHINGIHNDHRIENLRLLCPNCHSQTGTFCGRNIKETEVAKQRQLCKCGNAKLKESETCRDCADKNREKINWPPFEELLAMVKDYGYSKTAKKLDVSRTSVKKRLVRSPDPATG